MDNNYFIGQDTDNSNNTSVNNVSKKEETNMDNNFVELSTNNTPVHSNGNEGKASGFKVEPARELMDGPHNQEGFIIDELISQGLTVLSGKDGSAISSLALDMALCIAGDKNFLDRETKHGNAIYISTGEPRERIHAMLDGPAPENLDVACHAGCSWAELHEFLNTYLHGHPGTKAAIIDMAGISKTPENGRRDGYAHGYAGTEALKGLAEKHGAAIILASQCRQTRDRNGWVDEFTWGVCVPGMANAILILIQNGKESSEGILYIMGRDMAEEKLVIRLDEGNSKWDCLGTEDELELKRDLEMYNSSPAVRAIKILLEKNHGQWSGTSRELLDFGLKEFGEPIAPNESSLGRKINKLDEMFQKDCIIHIKPEPNGSMKGRVHHFIMADPSSGGIPMGREGMDWPMPLGDRLDACKSCKSLLPPTMAKQL